MKYVRLKTRKKSDIPVKATVADYIGVETEALDISKAISTQKLSVGKYQLNYIDEYEEDVPHYMSDGTTEYEYVHEVIPHQVIIEICLSYSSVNIELAVTIYDVIEDMYVKQYEQINNTELIAAITELYELSEQLEELFSTFKQDEDWPYWMYFYNKIKAILIRAGLDKW